MPYAFVDSDPQSNDESNASESVTSSPEATHSEIGQLRAELAALKSQLDQLKTDGSSADPDLNPDETEESTQLSQVVDHFDRRIGQVLELIEAPNHKAQDQNPLIGGLVSIGISKSHAEDLVARVSRIVPDGTPHDGDVLSSLQQMIADDLMTGGRIDVQDTHRRVMAFVGPTGVGKTTTVAKVASTARLAGKRVALITVDTCRAAAVEQLAGYAAVLDAPLKVVKDPKNLPWFWMTWLAMTSCWSPTGEIQEMMMMWMVFVNSFHMAGEVKWSSLCHVEPAKLTFLHPSTPSREWASTAFVSPRRMRPMTSA